MRAKDSHGTTTGRHISLLTLLVCATLAACGSSASNSGTASSGAAQHASAATSAKPKPSAATSTPAASAASAPTATPAPTLTGKPAGWPLPLECDIQVCKLDSGRPGVRCGSAGPCQNPCGEGRAPDKSGIYCTRLCAGPADCPGGSCTPEGACDFSPAPLACEAPEFCDLPGGSMGARCKPTDPCTNTCKKGLVLYGGTHCAKPCKGPADCPGGTCEEDICGPLCPSEGCPYLWE